VGGEVAIRCHGINGNSTRPARSNAAAQRADYLEKCACYRKGERKSRRWPHVQVLSEADVETSRPLLAPEARAVVYVMLPSSKCARGTVP